MRLSISHIVTDATEARTFLVSIVRDLGTGETSGPNWSLAPTRRETAKAEHRYKGRKPHDRETIIALAKTMRQADIARHLGIGRSSVSRALASKDSTGI